MPEQFVASCVGNVGHECLFNYLVRRLLVVPLHETEEAVAGDLVNLGVAESGEAGSWSRGLELILALGNFLFLSLSWLGLLRLLLRIVDLCGGTLVIVGEEGWPQGRVLFVGGWCFARGDLVLCFCDQLVVVIGLRFEFLAPRESVRACRLPC